MNKFICVLLLFIVGAIEKSFAEANGAQSQQVIQNASLDTPNALQASLEQALLDENVKEVETLLNKGVDILATRGTRISIFQEAVFQNLEVQQTAGGKPLKNSTYAALLRKWRSMYPLVNTNLTLKVSISYSGANSPGAVQLKALVTSVINNRIVTVALARDETDFVRRGMVPENDAVRLPRGDYRVRGRLVNELLEAESLEFLGSDTAVQSAMQIPVNPFLPSTTKLHADSIDAYSVWKKNRPKEPAKTKASANATVKTKEKGVTTSSRTEPIATKGSPDEVVASVNGTKYLRKEVDAIVKKVMASQNVPTEQQAEARKFFEQRVISSLIMRTLIMAEVNKADIKITDEDRKKQTDRLEGMLKSRSMTADQYFKVSPLGEEAARKEFDEGILIDKFLEAKVMSAIVITDDEVKKVIDDVNLANAGTSEGSKSLEAANSEKRAKLLSIKRQLDAGANFAELAKKYSDCPSKEKGGDLGAFTRGQMVKPFEDAAFSQEIGVVGDVVETAFGYHLIKVTAKSPAQDSNNGNPSKPESVTASHILVATERAKPRKPVPTSEEIRKQLKSERSKEAIQKYIEQLKSAAKIYSIYPDVQL